MEREQSTEYILSLSYGKDSLACLGAIEQLGWALDRIVHAEVWATDTIPADLPPMVEFKAKADAIIKERYGITVEHFDAGESYEHHFYRKRTLQAKSNTGVMYGFPVIKGQWCNSDLKRKALTRARSETKNIIYIGIAADEQNRFHNLTDMKKSPLVEAGWTEEICLEWCKENDLLSPVYTNSARGGCWFCHNQRVDQLRLLRKTYPDLWAILLQWDLDSPTTFKADGHTVHDYDIRYEMEDRGLVPSDRKFRWKMLSQIPHAYRRIGELSVDPEKVFGCDSILAEIDDSTNPLCLRISFFRNEHFNDEVIVYISESDDQSCELVVTSQKDQMQKRANGAVAP